MCPNVTLCENYQRFLIYQRFFIHFLLKLQISIMSTLASQLGQHFLTMVNLIFDTMDLHYGMKLMRDLRFLLLILSKENYACISLICIKSYYLLLCFGVSVI